MVITSEEKNMKTVKDLNLDEYVEYTRKYGRHGTLGRTTRKSIEEFLRELYY